MREHNLAFNGRVNMKLCAIIERFIDVKGHNEK